MFLIFSRPRPRSLKGSPPAVVFVIRGTGVCDSDTQKTIKSFPFSTSPSLIMAIHLFYKSCSDSRICGCAREPFSHLSSLLFDCAWFGFAHHNAGRRFLSANPSMPFHASGACARGTPTYFLLLFEWPTPLQLAFTGWWGTRAGHAPICHRYFLKTKK
jgi:hypothetical protein